MPRLTARRAAPSVTALALAVLVAVALVVTGPATGADDRRVLTTEHTDALHITYGGGALGVEARIGQAPTHTYADPADLIFQVVDTPRTRLTVPVDARYAFLGAPGTTTWVAPQVQDPTVLWPGWDTEDIPTGALADDAVTIALTEVAGPGGVEVFQTDTGGPRRIFSSTDPTMTLRQPVGAHVHASWAFSALGTYSLTFEVAARPVGAATTTTTGPVTYTFVVGDVPPSTTTTTAPVTTAPGSTTTTPSTTGPAPTTTVPGSTTTSPASTTTTRPSTDGACTGLAAVLDRGHVDIAARLVDGDLRTQVKDTTRGPSPVDWRDLDEVGLHVTDAARTQVPAGGAFGFLGGPGEEIWLLPQTQQADLLWPGWNTEAVDYDQLAGPVTWSLDAVEGPGSLAVYELGSLGDVRVVFDSDDPLPQSLAIPGPTHAHGNWAFDRAGIYHLTFTHRATAAGGRALESRGTVPVAVGDVDLAGLCPGGDVPAPEGGTGGEVDAGGPGSGPAGPVADSPHAYAPGAGTGTNGRSCAPVSAPPSTAPPTTATAVPSAAPVVLADGHVDYGVQVEDGRLRSLVKDGTVAGRTEWRDPSSVVLHVTPAGATEVPASGFDFLGDPGTPIWQIPQTQQDGLVWLGWNTEEVGPDQLSGPVRWTLDRVDGPGDLAVFQYDSFGAPEVILDSGDGTGDTYDIPLGVHAHGNWAFTAQGAYRVTMTHTATLATGGTVSDTQTLLVAVGDTDPGSLAPAPAAAPAPRPAAAPVVVTGADGCPRIARTGTELTTPLRTGTVLLAAGAVAVLAARRRRPA